MNNFAVIRMLGLLTLVIGATMFIPMPWIFIYHENTLIEWFSAIAITLLSGLLMYFFGSRKRQEVFRKEGLAIVGLGWLIAAFFGALPFVLTSSIPNIIDAYFETMSGYTTTGSSILKNIEALPKSILFWRSLTHWVGGMGIIVLFIAILPFLGAGGRHLYKSEVPGIVRESLTPKIKETAMILWKIYLIFTGAEVIILMFCGIGEGFVDNLFQALCHTFASLATGGFSTKNNSVAYFNSVVIEAVLIIFMFLAGANFSLHFRFMKERNLKIYFRDPEWRGYLLIILGATLIITLELWGKKIYPSIFTSLRHAIFNVVSIMTTTGFCTEDFNKWTEGSKVFLVTLMFIGGCGGSTGGGMKVIRWITLLKIAFNQTEKVFQPRSIRNIRIASTIIDEKIQLATLSFFFIFVFVFIFSTIIICLFNIDLVTSATAVAATLNNIGPGLSKVGAIENFSFLPYPVKILLSLCMVIGRLEVFSIIALFAPRFWKN